MIDIALTAALFLLGIALVLILCTQERTKDDK